MFASGNQDGATISKTMPAGTNPLEWLAAACNSQSENDEKAASSSSNKTAACTNNHPPSPAGPTRLERRISTNTNDATNALLEFARGSKASAFSSAEKVSAKKNAEAKGKSPATADSEVAKASSSPELQKAAAARHQEEEDAALRSLWLQQQQKKRQQLLEEEQARLLALERARAGVTMDPHGTFGTSEADAYPMDVSMHLRRRMSLPTASMTAGGLDANSMAMDELHLREALAREALLREQRFALAARRFSLTGATTGQRYPLSSMVGGAGASYLPSSFRSGRVMSLLQPLESVSTRSTPYLSHLSGSATAATQDPRMTAALVQARLAAQQRLLEQQQQRTLQEEPPSEEEYLRRASDASFYSSRRASDASHGPYHRPHGHNNAPDLIEEASRKPKELTAKARKTWDERMQQMKAFFIEHGHTQVLTRGEHKELGRWLSNIRCRIRDGLLPQDQVDEFMSMQDWTYGSVAVDEAAVRIESVAAAEESFTGHESSAVVDDTKPKRALPKSWNQSFEELKAFKKKFGHSDVKMIVSSPYGLLGKWLASQRSRYKLGQLPQDKVIKLQEFGCAGFGNTVVDGHTPDKLKKESVSIFQDEDEAEFDAAISRLKNASSGGINPTMNTTQREADSTPPSPDNKRDKRVRHSYETRIEHIKAFKEKHGHCKIRLGASDKHEELLARWLASARCRYRAGQFKEERAAELRELGCDGFNFCEAGADMQQKKAQEQAASGNDVVTKKRAIVARTATPSPVPKGDESQPPSKKQKSCNDDNKKEKSSQVGAPVIAKRQSFDDMLRELESYQYVFGAGCSVPKPDGEAGKLGRWLAFQRRQFLAGKLPTERILKLQSIGRREFSEADLVVRTAERAAARKGLGQ